MLLNILNTMPEILIPLHIGGITYLSSYIGGSRANNQRKSEMAQKPNMQEVRTVNYCLHNVLQCNLLCGAMNGIPGTVSSHKKKKKRNRVSRLARLHSAAANFHMGKHISVLG